LILKAEQNFSNRDGFPTFPVLPLNKFHIGHAMYVNGLLERTFRATNILLEYLAFAVKPV
jgi:hypothetical protein